MSRIAVKESSILTLPIPYRFFAFSDMYDNTPAVLGLFLANGYAVKSPEGIDVYEVLYLKVENGERVGAVCRTSFPSGKKEVFPYEIDEGDFVKSRDPVFAELVNRLARESVFVYVYSEVEADVATVMRYMHSYALTNRYAPAFLKAILSYPFFYLSSKGEVPRNGVLKKALEKLLLSFPELKRIPELIRLKGEMMAKGRKPTSQAVSHQGW